MNTQVQAGRRFRLLPGSIRFRLTAWYALLLALVLTILGFSVLRLAEDRLRDDVNDRLLKTATDINGGIRELAQDQVQERGWFYFPNAVPDLSSFAARGLHVQIVDAEDAIMKKSMYAPDAVLVTSPGDAGEEPFFRTKRIGESDYSVVHYPVVAISRTTGDEEIIGAVLVGEPLDNLYDTLDSLRQVLLAASLGGLALAVVGGWLLAGRALRPVDRVTAAAAQIAAGDGSAASLQTRLQVPASGDEIARLSCTFNTMLDRIAAAFATQRRFVADASHELRTPLTALRGNVDVLMRQTAKADLGAAGDDIAAALDDMRRESARMGRLLDDLLLLARADADTEGRLDTRPVRLDQVAHDAVRTAGALANGQRLEVVADPVVVRGDPDRLQQLLLILLENALRHTPPEGRIDVVVQAANGAAPARAIVRDTGEGIAPEHLPHVFDRFYRADGARTRATGGTGLGLAIARTIARAHGGEIAVASVPGHGATFTVTLPTEAVDRPAVAPTPRPVPSA